VILGQILRDLTAVSRRARPTVEAAEPPRKEPGCPQAGFTLLEVLVALTILALAVVTLIQLSSQSLRLVKTAGDYQGAAQLAERIATENQPTDEGVESGQDGPFQWERRVSLVSLPDEFKPPETVPDREPVKLLAVTIAVHWGQNQGLELATLHTPTTSPAATQTRAGGQQPTSSSTAGPTVPVPQPPVKR
jgi:prepilin-type N-terminal cleavage/methylation domain-containing protein